MPEYTTAPVETTIADADEFPFNDVSETPDALNRITWANIKATLKTYFDTLYQPLNSVLTALVAVFTPASASGAASLQFHEDTDNGTNKVTVTAPSALAGDVTATLPSSTGTLALTSYVDAAVVGLLDDKGNQDCSANPNYPAASKGDVYTVSVAGKIGGASGITVEVGDVFRALADNAGGTQAGVGTSWAVVQANLVGAYIAGGTDVPIADGGTGASTAPTALANLGGFPLLSLLRSYLAADVVYNSVDTLANTPLSVMVVTSGVYDIELVVHSTSAIEALNMDFGGTATVTNFIGQWYVYVATNPSVAASARVAAAGTDFTNSAGAAADAYFTFKGTIEVNVGGTFLLRGAQNASDFSDTTILRGSTLILTKLN